jgi:deoxyribodipyrimidine photo-lyase
VDLQQATREAKAKLHGVRARPEVKAGKAAIIEKHGSRKRGEGRAGKRAAADKTAQMTLEF